jgi:hypothetical protein
MVGGDVEVQDLFARAQLCAEGNRGIIAGIGLNEDHVRAA